MHFFPQLFYADSESDSKHFLYRHYPQKIFLKTFASEKKPPSDFQFKKDVVMLTS